MIYELGDNLIPVLAIMCTFLFLVTWVLMATIDSIYKTRCMTKLKERLIERGHSPIEIDQYLKAGTPDEWGESVQPVPPVKSSAFPST